MGDEGGGTKKKKEGREKGGVVEEEKKEKQRVHLSSLDFPGRAVCILSRAAPREFNSIFNLPKPLYANSATDVEYFWTFSTPFLRAFRPPPLRSTLIRSSPWHGFLPFEFAERKEAHVSATSCLLYECCIANLRGGS